MTDLKQAGTEAANNRGHIHRRLTFRRAFGMSVFILNCCVLMMLALVLVGALFFEGLGFIPIYVGVGIAFVVTGMALIALYCGIKDKPRRWLSKGSGALCLLPSVFLLLGMGLVAFTNVGESVRLPVKLDGSLTIVLLFLPWTLAAIGMFLLRRRLSDAHCLSCGKDMSSGAGSRCPECGFDGKAYAAQRSWCGRSTWVGAAVMLAFLCGIGWMVLEVLSVYRSDAEIDMAIRRTLTERDATPSAEGVNGWLEFELLCEEAESIESGLDPELWEAGSEELVDRAIEDATRQAAAEAQLFERLESVLEADFFYREELGFEPISFDRVVHLRGAHSLVRYLGQELHADLGREEWSAAVDRLRTMLRVASIVESQRTPREVLNGANLVRTAAECVIDGLTSHDVPSEVAAEMGVLLADCDSVSSAEFIELRRLESVELLSWLHGSSGYVLAFGAVNPSGFMATVSEITGSDRSMLAAIRARFFFASHQESIAICQRWHEEAVAALALPFASRWDAWTGKALKDKLETERFRFAEIAVMGIGNPLDDYEFLQVRLDVVRILVGLTQYRHVHGDLPDRLDALVPDFLDAVPSDRIGGGSFVYSADAADNDGPGFTLYSRGPNGVDDGGQFESEDNWYQPLRPRGAYDVNMLDAR